VVILDNKQALLDPSSLQDCKQSDSSKQLSRQKSALLKSRAVILTFGFFSSSQKPEQHHLMFTAAKASPDLLIVSQFSLGCKSQIQQSVFHHCIFIHLC